jgi:hypothetical protein
MAKIILMDWQRGKIPYFVVPPGFEDKKDETLIQPEQTEENQFDKNKKHGIDQDLSEINITNQYDEKNKEEN